MDLRRTLSTVPLAAAVSVLASGAPSPERVSDEPVERAVYDVRFGAFRIGTGTLTVSCDYSLSQPTRRISLFIRGGPPLYRVDDRFESWSIPATGASLRFTHSVKEGRRVESKAFTFDPTRSLSIDELGVQRATPEHPVDDAAFLYAIRGMPMTAGVTHRSERYFRPEANPISAEIVKRDTIRVPAGSFDAFLVRPFISGSSLFGESGNAEVWIATDSTHAVVMLTARGSIGSVSMRLRSFERGKSPACRAPGDVATVSNVGNFSARYEFDTLKQ